VSFHFRCSCAEENSGDHEVLTFLLWFFTALATLPLGTNSRHAKSWVIAALSDCRTSPVGELELQSPTGVDVCFVVYVVVANFVAPLTLMTFFYSRIYRTIRLHKMSVILRDVLITEVGPYYIGGHRNLRYYLRVY